MYASKYYDPVKAHEYYINYTKKGILKGRGKGGIKDDEAQRKRKSTASLTDEGKDIATIVKAQINEEYKAALKKIPTKNKAARAALKAEYQERYLQELDKIKADGKYNKPPKVKKAKTTGSRSSSSAAKKSAQEAKKKAAKKKKARKRQKAVKQLKREISDLGYMIANAQISSQDKRMAQGTISELIKKLKALRG